MAGQMSVVVVSGGWRRFRLAQMGGGGPPLSTISPLFPPFISRHRSPSGLGFVETANKRKSRSKFRRGFLFEEPGGFGGEPGFIRPSVVRPPCPAKPELCVKNQAESADDGGGCVSALNGPIDTPGPTKTKPSRQLDDGEEDNKHMVDSLERS